MKKLILPFLLFLLFISESLFVDLIPSQLFNVERMFVPRFVLISILYITIFLNPVKAVYFALTFGLLFDVIYTEIIGVYTFSFAFIAYLLSLVMKLLHTNLFIVFFTVLAGISLLEFFAYAVTILIGITNMSIETFLNNRLFPTLVLNGVFIIITYYPFRKYLILLKKHLRNEN